VQVLRNGARYASLTPRLAIAQEKATATSVPPPPPAQIAPGIPTLAGKSWFAYFRLFEPTETYFDKSRPLGDFEKVK